MLKRPTAVNLENDSKTTRKKDENNTKKKGNQNEENCREKAAMLYWGRGVSPALKEVRSPGRTKE